jgi:predicted component of type VI protein secretion system
MLVLRVRGARTDDQSWQVTQGTRVSRDDQSAGIVLPDRSVSRRHASIALVNGVFILTDDGSRNGTFVNGRPVTGATTIKDGDQVAFGDVVLVAELTGSGPPPALGPETADTGRTVLYPGGPPGDPGAPPPGSARRGQDTSIDTPQGPRLAGHTGPARALRASEPLPPSPPPPPAEIPDVGKTLVYGRPGSPAPPRTRSARPTPGAAEAVRAQAVVPAAPVIVRDPQPSLSLPELVADAQALAATLRRYGDDLQIVLRRVEQLGGRSALQDWIDRLARIQTSSATARDLDLLTSMMPTLRQMLEAELALVDLLAPPSGGRRSREEL